MAVDVLRETLYDPFDGRKDVKDGRWRWLLTRASTELVTCGMVQLPKSVQ